MRSNFLKAILRTAALAGASVLLTAGLSSAADVHVYLQAQSFDKTLPGGASVPMWGFALCNATFTSCALPAAPGPQINLAIAELASGAGKYRETPAALRQLAAFLSRLEGVEEVQYGQEWIDRMAAVLNVMRLIGLSVGLALGVASLLIVSNTVRLAIYARAEEIEIMRLVGATKTTVRLPFLLEGLIQGGAGAGLALGLLFAAYRITLYKLQMAPGQASGLGLGSFLPASAVMTMLAVGAALGAIGSLLSVSRLLRA